MGVDGAYETSISAGSLAFLQQAHWHFCSKLIGISAASSLGYLKDTGFPVTCRDLNVVCVPRFYGCSSRSWYSKLTSSAASTLLT